MGGKGREKIAKQTTVMRKENGEIYITLFPELKVGARKIAQKIEHML